MAYLVEEISADLELDRMNLELETQKQGTLFQKWATLLADAKAEKGRADNALKLEMARLAQVFRGSKLETTGKFPTNDAVTELVDQHPAIQTARELVVTTSREVSVLEGVVRGMEHKKSSIDNLCYLATSSYYQASISTGDPQAHVEAGRDHLNS